MPPPSEGRAWLAVGCGLLVLAVLLWIDTALTVLFGTLGAASVGAAVVASDAGAGARTRSTAVLVCLVAVALVGAALILVLSAPSSGE
jgi:hypothetical protein